MRSNILVTYYSRTGTTESLAESIARACSADLLPIIDVAHRGGPVGYLRALAETALRLDAAIAPVPADTASFDVVAVGTPCWGNRAASPVRTFLKGRCGRFRRLAFFATDSGTADHDALFEDMAALANQSPFVTLCVAHDVVRTHRHDDDALLFGAALLRAATMHAREEPRAYAPFGIDATF